MAGTMIRVGASITGGNNPKIRMDKFMDGSDILFHDVSRQEGLVPVHGSVITNHVATEAAAIIGGGALASELHGSLSLVGGNTVAAAEKTTKGGLHLRLTAGALTTGQRAQIPIPQKIVDFMYARTTGGNTDKFYVWARFTPTRIATGTARPFFLFGNLGSHTSNYAFNMRAQSGILPATEATVNPDATPAVDENALFELTFSALTGTVTTSQGLGIIFGNPTGPSSAGLQSQIMYQWGIKYMPSCPFTVAELKAKNLALHNEYFADGGRFDGDTYTAPMA